MLSFSSGVGGLGTSTSTSLAPLGNFAQNHLRHLCFLAHLPAVSRCLHAGGAKPPRLKQIWEDSLLLDKIQPQLNRSVPLLAPLGKRGRESLRSLC